MQDEFWLTYAVTAFLENFWYLVVATFGAVVGSFLGVVIYRLPIIELTQPGFLPKGYSLSNPPSYCPHCKHKLESWENVPILGFLWLRGRCSDCKKPIPWRDFAMELLTASAWVAIFHRYNGDNPVAWVNVVLLALFASVLIAAVFIDLDHFIVPEALNRVGVVIGLARDVAVIGIAFLLMQMGSPDDWSVRWNGARLWQETITTYTYFGWLPRGFVGAALYAGLLWLVSFSGFVFYARADGESFASVAKRFFTYEDAPVIEDTPPSISGAPSTAGIGIEKVPAVADSATVTSLPGNVSTPSAELAASAAGGMNGETSEEEDDSPPVRLRFSPGFIVLLSAGLLSYVVGPWGMLTALLPLAAFIALTRTPTESADNALRRFFRSDDLPYDYDAPTPSLAAPTPEPVVVRTASEPVITGSNVGAMVWNKEVGLTDPLFGLRATTGVESPPEVGHVSPAPTPQAPLSFAESQADADQFAKEAESGAHGGMGLGDVKLAIAIGAILGPGQAVLSLIFAAFFGAVTGLILKAIHRKDTMRLAVPFVPFMAAGAFVCLLFGEQIITWYMGFYSSPQTPAISRTAGPRLLPDGRVELPSDARFPGRGARQNQP
ncbi:MAG: A24 family peptidase [Akkermansiaceae bacterium]|nr:A24 family peptidase [Armatimonadota bacterium]